MKCFIKLLLIVGLTAVYVQIAQAKTLKVSGPIPPQCGNSIQEQGEECDDGNSVNTDGCLNGCILATCGDGYVNYGVEACDDATFNGMTGYCNANCSAIIPATIISNDISQNTTWSLAGSPYVIASYITIQPGATLTIDPGVEVRFNRNTRIYNNGILDAQGSSGAMIKFTSNLINPSRADWSSIVLTDSSTVKYSIVEYGWSGLYPANASPIISNNVIQENFYGIRIIENSNPSVTNNEFRNNGTGISIENEVAGSAQTQAIVQSNTFDLNQIGIGIRGNASPIISGNTIKDNLTYGIWLYDGPYYLFPSQLKANNNVIQNNGTNVYIQSGGDNKILDFENNYWGTTDSTLIANSIRDASENEYFATVDFLPYLDSNGSAYIPLCGDGNLDGSEECDDGNTISGDGCNEECQPDPFCGDGYVDAGEQCDDGNNNTGDGCGQFCQNENITYVGGIISTNRTWSKINSPYFINQNISVGSGATLTIEPGVQVRFTGSYIMDVYGTLRCEGTPAEMITISSSHPRPGIADWRGINLSDSSIVRYAKIEDAIEALVLYNDSAIIEQNIIKQNHHGIGIYIDSSPSIDSNTVQDNVTGLYFSNLSSASGIPSAVVTNNLIDNNDQGIYLRGFLSPTFQLNDVTNNKEGFYLFLPGSNNLSGASIGNNNIYDNTNYNVYAYYGQALTINFLNNWWGTTNPTQIESKIYHSVDNSNSATINFTPYSQNPF